MGNKYDINQDLLHSLHTDQRFFISYVFDLELSVGQKKLYDKLGANIGFTRYKVNRGFGGTAVLNIHALIKAMLTDKHHIHMVVPNIQFTYDQLRGLINNIDELNGLKTPTMIKGFGNLYRNKIVFNNESVITIANNLNPTSIKGTRINELLLDETVLKLSEFDAVLPNLSYNGGVNVNLINGFSEQPTKEVSLPWWEGVLCANDLKLVKPKNNLRYSDLWLVEHEEMIDTKRLSSADISNLLYDGYTYFSQNIKKLIVYYGAKDEHSLMVVLGALRI